MFPIQQSTYNTTTFSEEQYKQAVLYLQESSKSPVSNLDIPPTHRLLIVGADIYYGSVSNSYKFKPPLGTTHLLRFVKDGIDPLIPIPISVTDNLYSIYDGSDWTVGKPIDSYSFLTNALFKLK